MKFQALASLKNALCRCDTHHAATSDAERDGIDKGRGAERRAKGNRTHTYTLCCCCLLLGVHAADDCLYRSSSSHLLLSTLSPVAIPFLSWLTREGTFSLSSFIGWFTEGWVQFWTKCPLRSIDAAEEKVPATNRERSFSPSNSSAFTRIQDLRHLSLAALSSRAAPCLAVPPLYYVPLP